MVAIEELTESRSAEEWKGKGNLAFKAGNYEDSLEAYNKAIESSREDGQLKSTILFNRGTALFHLSRFSESVESCTEAILLNSNYIKALYRRAKAHEKLEQFTEAIHDFERMFELDTESRNQHNKEYRQLIRLRDEKFEKEKGELMTNLKDIGNKLLGNFGLSLDNFKLEKNETGNYSIQFNNDSS